MMRVKGPSLWGVRGGIRSKTRIFLEYGFIIMTRRRRHWIPVRKSAFLELPSTICPSGTDLPGGKRNQIYLRIEYNPIMICFTIYIM